MNKLSVMFLLIVITGCVSMQHQVGSKSTNHQDSNEYLTLQTIVVAEEIETETGRYPAEIHYQLPTRIRPLPIDLYTWYPKGSTLFLPIGDMGITGKFIWHDDCLLFRVIQTNEVAQMGELITPIFWVNSIKGYHDKNGEHALIRHDDKEIALNTPYHIDVNPEPKQNNRTDWIVQHGQNKCLMDKVVYLPSSVVDGV